MANRGGADQEIEVINEGPFSPQPTALLSEYTASLGVNLHHIHAFEKGLKRFLIMLRIRGIQDTFV